MQYTRSECARLFGICMDALRYFESIGLVTPEKGEGNRRLYCMVFLLFIHLWGDVFCFIDGMHAVALT